MSDISDRYILDRIDYLSTQEDISTLIVHRDVEPDYESLSITGTVIISENALYPCAGGFDLGCGLGVFETELEAHSAEDITRLLTQALSPRSPFGIRRKRYSLYALEQGMGEVPEYLSEIMLGAVERGNHFVELRLCCDLLYIVIHSGVPLALKNETAARFVRLFRKYLPHRMDEDNAYILSLPAQGEDAEDFLRLSAELNALAAANRAYIGNAIARALGTRVTERLDSPHEYICREKDGGVLHCSGAQEFRLFRGEPRALVLSGANNENHIVPFQGERFIYHGTPLAYRDEEGRRVYEGCGEAPAALVLKPVIGCKRERGRYEYRLC